MAQLIVEAEAQSLERRGRFVLALEGGEVASALGAVLRSHADSCNWDAWHVFFVAETIGDERRTASRAWSDALFAHVPIPPGQVHVIPATADLIDLADQLAEDYERTILEAFNLTDFETIPQFDLVVLALHPDGGCAALRPGHRVLAEDAWLVSAVHEPPTQITFTLPLLNAARRLAFVARGRESADVLSDVLDGLAADLPASRVALPYRPLTWFADPGAAATTAFERSRFWAEE